MKDQTIETFLQEILEAVERIRRLVPKDEDVLASLDDIRASVKSLQK